MIFYKNLFPVPPLADNFFFGAFFTASQWFFSLFNRWKRLKILTFRTFCPLSFFVAFSRRIATVFCRFSAIFRLFLLQNWSKFLGAFFFFPPLAVRGFFRTVPVRYFKIFVVRSTPFSGLFFRSFRAIFFCFWSLFCLSFVVGFWTFSGCFCRFFGGFFSSSFSLVFSGFLTVPKSLKIKRIGQKWKKAKKNGKGKKIKVLWKNANCG